MSERPIFAADSIGKKFGERAVLKSASAWGWAGRVTALLGRNGSGKSTLMKIAAGVLAADHGAVRIGDETFLRPRLHTLAARGLYFLPDRNSIPLDMTLRALIASVATHFHATSSVDAVKIMELQHLLDIPVVQLSGGQQKAVETAVAIARGPSVLLADEPFAGISPLDADHIATGLRALCATGCAVILSGHEVPNILDIADEIVWVTAGTTHALGTSAHARTHHQFCTEYLGMKAIHHVA